MCRHSDWYVFNGERVCLFCHWNLDRSEYAPPLVIVPGVSRLLDAD